jgi:WD40 repeat protein
LDINKNGQYFVTGGKDGKVKLWKYSDLKNPVRVWEFDEEINDIKISSQEQWIAVATNSNVFIVDIQAQNKENEIIAEISNVVETKVQSEDSKDGKLLKRLYKAMSLSWDEKSQFIFVGCDNGLLKIIPVIKKGL